MPELEYMDAFFEKRIGDYDEHMLGDVEGCREGYEVMAQLVPQSAKSLLDLGCGTGLELDAIFRRLPDLAVTGIDMTQAMLDRLREKHPGKQLRLICGDYFKTDFGIARFDCAVSFETMHHFSPADKLGLYKRLCASIKDSGVYLECDYMVGTQIEEDHHFAVYEKLRREQNIPADVFCHYDTPCTVDKQISLLTEAGFKSVEKVFCIGNTVMLSAKK